MKVKVIKLYDRFGDYWTDEERERVGKVFEALKFHDPNDEDEIYCDVSDL